MNNEKGDRGNVDFRHEAGNQPKTRTTPSTNSYASIIWFRSEGLISAQQKIEHPLVKVDAKVGLICENLLFLL